MKTNGESGIALITALLVLVLLSALLTGFIITVNSDQGLITVDRDQSTAYYGAQAGLERLTADLGNLFDANFAPTPAQLNALTANPPAVPGITFAGAQGGSGYQIAWTPDARGNPASTILTISSGPYAGLVGELTPYTMNVTAHTANGAEVKMQRKLQTVQVPVFQFGIFSDTDLSFHAGPDFNFGGRVHTNGNLFLAEDGGTLTLSDKVTALKEVIRTNLINGHSTSSDYNTTVNVARAPGVYRALARNEGSLVGPVGSAQNEPTWTNLSIGTYNGYIRNGRTGTTRLDLPLVRDQATPIDIIRRPAQNSTEPVTNSDLWDQRAFAYASLRILLSDTQGAITSLPSVTAAAPVRLVGRAPDAQGTYFAVAGAQANGYRSDPGPPVATGMIDGYIKIEMCDNSGIWWDVTNEILALGIAGKDLTYPNPVCADQPNAVLRFQRFKDSPGACTNTDGLKYWPNVLYDTREGALRDNIANNEYRPYLGGVMHYVELDVNNLCRWFTGAIGASGTTARTVDTGYVVYFSDRRGNHDNGGNESAEYGFEDFVNPLDANGLPNGQLDTGEDVNGNGNPDNYGILPTQQLPPGAVAPLDNTARPWFNNNVSATIARVNRPIFFRRALKLVNGSSINLGVRGNGVVYGLSVATENPFYVQGDFNVVEQNYNGAHVAVSLLADAVTLLSNSWNDHWSFNCPHSLDSTCIDANHPGRIASTTYYRAAIIAGKGVPFPQPNGAAKDFGTDGGVHNFFRLLENWSNKSLNYRGSIVGLFYNRQAVGTYKCCTNVYSPPTRGYNFDTDFLTPDLLPPRTPSFRDVNITGFTRLLMPGQ